MPLSVFEFLVQWCSWDVCCTGPQ